MLKVAIVGIRGLPNNYGGFETLAEYLVEYLASDLSITVYCSSKDMASKINNYKGASLEYVPFTSHGAVGILYDSISLLKAVRKFDKILFLGFGGGFVMPFIGKRNRAKIILNIGGLDWKRNKWSPLAQKVIKKAEALLVENSDYIISDNIGIQEYLLNEYNRESRFIAYGGDQAERLPISEEARKEYPFLNHPYAFSVTRIQPDNNIELILKAFTLQNKIPLVMVGNWSNSNYGKEIKAKYHGHKNLHLVEAIYDRARLDVIRSNCKIYIHGHSAGGTNPSLAEAMYLGLPVFAFASGYNEYTTENNALYFSDVNSLIELIKNQDTYPLAEIGMTLKESANKLYRWELVSKEYKEVFLT